MAENYDDILAQAAERFKFVCEYDREERELADDDIRFATNDEGCQWPSSLKKEREDEGRPCIVANKIPEKIDQVDGEFKQMQPSFKVRAVDSTSDPKIAEIYSGLMRHIEYNSAARNAYNSSHTSTLYCGRGAWRINVIESEDDPWTKDIRIGRIPNVLTVYWDPYAKESDLSDANWFFVTELVDKKEFEKDYKEAVENWPDDNIWDNWRNGDSYRVAEYWWKEKSQQSFYRVRRMINGVPTETTTSKPEFSDEIIEEKKAPKVIVRWCKMVARQIIDGPYDWTTSDIPIIVELGKEINIRGVRKTRGMVRHAKDPQRMYDYWTSSVTEQVSLAPKAPYIVEIDAIKDFQEFWNQAHTKNFSYLPYRADPAKNVPPPRREPPPMVSTAYQAEFVRLEHDIMSAMGIYAAQLGDQSNEQSGRAILARQKQGNIGSFPYTDSFNIAYTYSCKQVIRLIPYVYDTERIVRIIGPDGQEDTVPINARPNMPEAQNVPQKFVSQPKQGITDYLNDLTVGKYDIAVSIGPSYTTQREETLTILMDMVKTAPMLAQAVMDLIAANMDIPKHSEELVKRLKKMVPIGIRDLDPGEEPPQQQPDPKMLLEMAKLQLEKEIKEAQLNLEEYKAQMKAAADLMTAESKEAGNQVQQMVMVAEQIRKMVEHQYQVQGQGIQQQHDMEMGQRDMALKEQQAQQMVQQRQVNPTETMAGQTNQGV